MKAVNFEVTPDEREVIAQIVQRALPLYEQAGYDEFDALDVTMDIKACHANGCPLNLVALLEADDFQFAHDVLGIARHMNRTTGQLEGYFLPRYALPQPGAIDA